MTTLTRRQALTGFLTTAAGLLVPEPRRVYSFLPGTVLTFTHSASTTITLPPAPASFNGRILSIAINGRIFKPIETTEEWNNSADLAKRPPVQSSTLSTPQENQDRNQIDEASGTKSVQIAENQLLYLGVNVQNNY